MKPILTGSTYFFKTIDGFKSKDIDQIILVDVPKGFNYSRQTSTKGACLFEWKRMTPQEFIEITLKTKSPMSICKFLIPEFNQEIGFTLNNLKALESVTERLDDKHKYLKVIYDAYLTNGDFILTDDQRTKAYEEYRKYRTKVQENR